MASAEPGRKAPYSVDLRWRIVWQRIGMDFEFRKIANNLNVSLGTVHNIYKQFSLTGDPGCCTKAAAIKDWLQKP